MSASCRLLTNAKGAQGGERGEEVVLRRRDVLQEAVFELSSAKTHLLILGRTNSVPSVGIDPPTPVPSPNSARQSSGNVGANALRIPKTLVSSSVKLNAGVRPCASESAIKRGSAEVGLSSRRDEQLPQPQAPTCIAGLARG